MTGYRVILTIDSDSTNYLTKEGFTLYGFKAIATGSKSSQPLVWFADSLYSTDNDIEWRQDYNTYGAPYKAGDVISSRHEESINSGEIYRINQPNGMGPKPEAQPNPEQNIQVMNNAASGEVYGGLSQKRLNFKEEFRPLNRTELAHGVTVRIWPVEQILLYFSTAKKSEGSVVTQASTRAIVVNLTDSNLRRIGWSKDNGWLWDWDESSKTWLSKANWASRIDSGTDFTSKLILPEPTH
ncbi:hypothetical protein [Kitasatospora sp. NPDC056531]|uniref:hypothetical protein n=1 Tax=Kitasatospora sp. NPDC056531 TaxID=3345856 RepID=UPI0036BB9AB5